MIVPIEDFIQEIELKDIKFVGVHGEVPGEIEKEDLPDRMNLDYKIVSWHEEIKIAFRVSLEENGAFQVSIEVLVIYENPDVLDLANEDKSIFISDVAFMSGFPYIREGFSSLAIRLQLPSPILGIMRRGEFEVDVENDSSSDISIDA